MPPALVTCWTGYPYPMVICPVPRKVDGKGLADLEPGFLSWWEGWGRKGSNRVGRRENGLSSSTSLPPLHELSRIQFLATAWGTQAGLEVSPAQHPLLAALSGDLWRNLHLPISAHLLPFSSPLRGLAFLSGSPKRGYHCCINTFWNAELSSLSSNPHDAGCTFWTLAQFWYRVCANLLK